MDAEITNPDENPPVSAGQLQRVTDELEQKLQMISIAPEEANLELNRHNHLAFSEEELVNNNDIDVTSKSSESSTQKQSLLRSAKSLPDLITDVDQDEKVWRYVCTYVMH